jgi:hypothetical protein
MNDTTIFSDDVLAAAVIAYNVNDKEYIKVEDRLVYDDVSRKFIENPNYKRKNIVIIEEFLKDATGVTDAIREEVAKIKQFFQNTLTVKILTNDSLNDFDAKVMAIASEVRVSTKHLAIAAYMPKYYETERVRQEKASRLANSVRDYVADIGSRVSTNIEVISSNFSVKYNCWFFTAMTENENRVFFAYSGNCPVEVGKKYSIKATVKRHDAEFVTVFSRVKFDTKSKIVL